MKIFTLSFFALSFLMMLTGQVKAQPGATCVDAVVISSLPYNQTGLSTSTTADNYDALPCASGTLGNYISGNDYLFTYTPSSTEIISVTLTNTANSTSIFITDACPDVASSCVAYSIESIDHSVSNVTLVAGTQYFIIISSLQFFTTGQTIDFDINIQSCPTAPTADFTYVVSDTSVTFTNTSVGGSTYSWFFGDELLPFPSPLPATSTDANPVHEYTGYGDYVVNLIVTNACGGKDTITQTITLDCPGNDPVSNFTYTANSLDVTFNSSTSTDADTYAWYFGDELMPFPSFLPASSTDANPAHTYTAYGDYDVVLVTFNECSSDTMFLTITLECPGDDPEANFTFTQNGADVSFQTTSQFADSVGWFFGDELTTLLGPSSFENAPTHTYTQNGTFTVSCIAYNECGTDTITQTVTITTVSAGSINSDHVSVTCFPNPAQDVLNINISGIKSDIEISLINSLGQVVYTKKGNNHSTINVSEFAKGVYTLSSKGNNLNQQQYIIIK